MDVVLGLDTSCYTTSVAAVDHEGLVVASKRLLLPVENGKRGLRQSEAVFAHVRQLPQVMGQLMPQLQAVDAKICAVAASGAPRAGEDSYMPVFLVGLGQAQALASALGVPCYQVTHQQGHIAAGQIGHPAMPGRFLALHLSGGTTELLLCEAGQIAPLGGTLDLHAGQMIDRVGVALGLCFPAGPELERLALQWGEPAQALLPASLASGGLHCHLSGAETRCQQWIEEKTLSPQQIALEVFDFLARTVARMLVAGCEASGVDQALVVGGVASSSLLRAQLDARMDKLSSRGQTRPQLIFGKPDYSADNAAGVALLGAQRHWGNPASAD